MNSMQDIILEYRQSYTALQNRLALLNDKIYQRVPWGEEESLSSLVERRRCIYIELTEMEEVIFQMRRYITDYE